MNITEQSTIFGEASVPEEQITRRILSRPHGEYTEHDVGAVIVPTYFAVCAIIGVNPVIVIAQALYETANLTSWWAARPRRNPAGIGVNGGRRTATPEDRTAWAYKKESKLWLAGVSFDTWEDDAIPAHVGRLLAWFLKPADRSVAQRQLVAAALAYRPLALTQQGSARTLRELGKRNNPSGVGWASPGPTYGRNVAATALRLQRGR